MLGAIALLATPSFVEQGAWQYADIPLSFFYLATIVLLSLYDERTQEASSQSPAGLLALGGVAAGFAAWTKNEGVLFLGAIILARQQAPLSALTQLRCRERRSPLRATAVSCWREARRCFSWSFISNTGSRRLAICSPIPAPCFTKCSISLGMGPSSTGM